MSDKAKLLLHVQNLSNSLAFFGHLGWLTEWQDAALGVAQLAVSGSISALLTANPDLDVAPYMEPRFEQGEPGKVVYLGGAGDLAAYQRRLAASGIKAHLAEHPVKKSRHLTIPTPDGPIIGFYEQLPMTDDEIVALYRRGPALLADALAGLSDAELDLVRAPGKWSIRQIVLHFIDSDFGTTYRMRFALAEPGRLYTGNPYNPDTWAAGLDYAHRPITTEVQLFGLIRTHILTLVGHLPDALDRTVVDGKGNATSVRAMMRLVADHAHGHIDQIWETRRVHGK